MTGPVARKFDPIAMEVFSNRLLSITEDMGNNLIRSSFSTNIKERRDCSVGLFDALGRLVCQATHIPLHLGSLQGSVTAVLARYSADTIHEGDAFICNDPYLANGTHLPDITIVTPVFHAGRLAFFTANVGHHSDVGGSVPGSIDGGARSIFSEGIRIPVIRIVRAGELDEDLLNLIVQNTREPEERLLDLKVQIATNERGAAAVLELVEQMGFAAVQAAIEDILDYTARRLRNRIRELAPGSYSYTGYLDDDGSGVADPVPIRVSVHVEGEDLHFDFAGSGPQAKGAVNLTFSALEAVVYYAVKALLDPGLMPNNGMFAPIKVTAPSGTIVNADPGGAVGARASSCQRVAGAIFGAFHDLLPEHKRYAQHNNACPALTFSGPRGDRPGRYVYLETLGGGAGASLEQDGMHAIHVHITNTQNLPAEALEIEYSLLVEEYGIVRDSGGSGRRRGGLGIGRQIRATRDGTIFSVRSEGHVVPADGLAGGGPGGTAKLWKNPGRPGTKLLHSKAAFIELAAGDAIRLETPGGGGYGPPAERPAEALARDLRDDLISREKAERDYGSQKVTEAERILEARSGA
ncbi:hydantoinase B/oxoprolinase family protein [Elioraea rosea]|uniref:hydantoinase B/oxoprolinase family protein n=1 Tax=Elioraea rosea TaxID=2492390 RepID=UPI0011841AFD|nr:hydantoinase B/oxoprolinase family protein [Elioraea rosea]